MKAIQATPEFIEWTKDTVRKLMKMTRAIVASGDEHVPVLFIYPKDNKLPVQMLPMGPFYAQRDTTGKDVAGLLHQQLALDPAVLAAIAVNETWTLLRPLPKEDRAKVMREGIEHHPDRGEAIMFNCIHHTGEQLVLTYHIKRPENTMPDTPNVVLDPVIGILDGDEEHRKEIGQFGGGFGRMVVKPETH